MSTTPASRSASPGAADTSLAHDPRADGSARRRERQPGDLLVRVGGVMFAIGALATLITFVPFFIGTEPFPSVAYFVSMLMGVGFALAAAGFGRQVVDQRRRTRAAAG